MRLFLHHSEAIDPTLVAWIRHQIDALLGFRPLTIVVLLSAVVVVFPLVLAAFVFIQRHRAGR